MSRRGLTLLELLLAIGLMLALAALVLPAVLSSFNERAFQSGVDVVQGQMLLARAHARMVAAPVEVLYDDEPPRVQARFFQQTPGDIPANWALRPLPGGLRITADDADGETPAQPLRLAVFMPDGSAVLARPVRVTDEHGRLGRLSLSSWTGMPQFERGAAGPAEEVEKDDAEVEPEADVPPRPEPEPEPEPDADPETEPDAEEPP